MTGTSGKPLTALAAHPNYQNDSEIPTTARGRGFTTVDGFKRRTPAEWDVSVQAAYSLNLPNQLRVTLLADAFNLFQSPPTDRLQRGGRTVVRLDQS